MSTEDLTSLQGVGPPTAEKLMNAGIPNVVALASSTVPKLVNIGIGKATAKKMLDEARVRCQDIFGFVTGDDLIKQFKGRQYLTSGCSEIDRILGGKGFETQKVYGIYGPEGTGKSNLLHQLICTAYLPPNQGGLGSGAIFIDTEGTFSLKRIQQFAQRWGIDPEEISKNVIKAAPPNSDVLLFVCETQLEKMAHVTGARLFCLDSIATHFRAEYGSERQHMPERQQKASKVIHALKRVAQQLNGVAILTNQATGNVTGIGREWKHSMGLLVGHEVQVRLMIRIKKAATGMRLLKVEKALDLPPEECEVILGSDGFRDPVGEEKKTTKKKKTTTKTLDDATEEKTKGKSKTAKTSS